MIGMDVFLDFLTPSPVGVFSRGKAPLTQVIDPTATRFLHSNREAGDLLEAVVRCFIHEMSRVAIK